MQIQALESDERLGLVKEYLDRLLPDDWMSKDLSDRRFWLESSDEQGTVPRETVSVMEIWAECFKNRPEDKKRSDSDDIVRILQQLGWKSAGRKAVRIPVYGVQKIYIRS